MKEFKDASEEGLDVRDQGGITFAGAYKPGEADLHRPVEDGDQVTLKRGDQYILVKSVELTEPGQYSGTIYGFENPMGLESGNLKIDDTIQFTEKHIFTCGKRL